MRVVVNQADFPACASIIHLNARPHNVNKGIVLQLHHTVALHLLFMRNRALYAQPCSLCATVLFMRNRALYAQPCSLCATVLFMRNRAPYHPAS